MGSHDPVRKEKQEAKCEIDGKRPTKTMIHNRRKEWSATGLNTAQTPTESISAKESTQWTQIWQTTPREVKKVSGKNSVY